MTHDIDSYISTFPENAQELLNIVRKTIHEAAPEATEKISYAMPTFYLEGNLVHFAGYKNHIGLYPAPSALDEFKEEISQYKNSKGAVQFPLDKPIPADLITKIVKYRVGENLAAAKKKKHRICKNGHEYYKSSDCPTCPECEKENKPKSGFMAKLSAPASRALKNNGITDLKHLSKFTEKEILELHGIGKTAIPILKAELAVIELKFRE
jgi:uncharacterized protein YdhG (YjbR/CyaY superfamily)